MRPYEYDRTTPSLIRCPESEEQRVPCRRRSPSRGPRLHRSSKIGTTHCPRLWHPALRSTLNALRSDYTPDVSGYASPPPFPKSTFFGIGFCVKYPLHALVWTRINDSFYYPIFVFLVTYLKKNIKRRIVLLFIICKRLSCATQKLPNLTDCLYLFKRK